MKKLSLFLILFSVLYNAQNQRFIYEYHFVRDTLNKSDVSKELMYLDISKDGSKFYSRDVFVRDSTRIAKYEKEIAATGSMNFTGIATPRKNALVSYKVFKTYPAYKISLQTRNGSDSYKVLDERKIDWKILPEKMKIGEFEAQKAISYFAGRKWMAWFSTELPFQDGPYKFHGLPGLIIKLEDESKTHQYELKAVNKYVATQPRQSKFDDEDPINITQEKYKKLFWELRDDPAKAFKEMMSKGNMGNMQDGNGSAVSAAAMIKRTENIAKENQAKNNNLIELDLLIR